MVEVIQSMPMSYPLSSKTKERFAIFDKGNGRSVFHNAFENQNRFMGLANNNVDARDQMVLTSCPQRWSLKLSCTHHHHQKTHCNGGSKLVLACVFIGGSTLYGCRNLERKADRLR